jgi:hypothetical protein
MEAFPLHRMLIIFSYLSGADLYHKVSLLNKGIRHSLPKAGLMDQVKLLSYKEAPKSYSYLKYALSLVNVVELTPTDTNL